MAFSRLCPSILGLVVLFFFGRPALAFGAGNIGGLSKLEGKNWRHGDIEDTLLKIFMARALGGKKFDRMMVSRVYFGNWLRDYSQAIDLGTVKFVSAEAIRLLLSILGFITFGYGSREFEVTMDRIGCYRPEEHIDNPKGYDATGDPSRAYSKLRGPINEEVELAIDERTGMKNYIANENVGIMTSACHIREMLGGCIRLGRRYQRTKRKTELYEALRLLGDGLHCLEDFLAHSNYVELALIEMGERDVFPHVGSDTLVQIRGVRGKVYPCVTGTFGGVDFLHSITGEVGDKMSQYEQQQLPEGEIPLPGEISELENALKQSQNSDTSFLQDLLDKVPDGLFGDKDQKQNMQKVKQDAQNAHIEPPQGTDTEEFTEYAKEIFRQIMPVIEFHDEVMQGISEAVEKIPILPKVIEQLEDQLATFVFSLIAPFVLPLTNQIKNELSTGSQEVINSSAAEQKIVFRDSRSTNPTHSMLSKDHFSNILNSAAGVTASRVVAWVVPQIMDLWDNEENDVNETLDRVVKGVLHHPAQREMDERSRGATDARAIMFQSVQEWWDSVDQNDYRRRLSREGVDSGENHKGPRDCGHGSGKPLGMHKNFAGSGGGGGNVEDKFASAIISGVSNQLSSMILGDSGQKKSDGGLGGIIGGILGGFKDNEKATFLSSGLTQDGGYQQTATEYGQSGNRYGTAQYSETRYSDGRETRRYEEHIEETTNSWSRNDQEESYGRHKQNDGESDYGRNESSYGRQEGNESGYGRQGGGEADSYIRQSESCGGRGESRFGRQEQYEPHDDGGGGHGQGEGHGRQESDYGGRGEGSYGRQGGGYSRQGEGYALQEEGYGRQEGGYGGREDEQYGQGDEDSYGGGNYNNERKRQDDGERRGWFS